MQKCIKEGFLSCPGLDKNTIDQTDCCFGLKKHDQLLSEDAVNSVIFLKTSMPINIKTKTYHHNIILFIQ